MLIHPVRVRGHGQRSEFGKTPKLIGAGGRLWYDGRVTDYADARALKRARVPTRPKPPSKATLHRRPREAEAPVKALRIQMAQLEEGAERPRPGQHPERGTE
jgi:hypothetical protein